MPKPSSYRHVAAWGQMMNSAGYYIKEKQEEAAQDDAPLDAIYKLHGEDTKNGKLRWILFSEVTNPDTRWVMGNILKSYGIETEDGA
jgi:hypothetical protein